MISYPILVCLFFFFDITIGNSDRNIQSSCSLPANNQQNSNLKEIVRSCLNDLQECVNTGISVSFQSEETMTTVPSSSNVNDCELSPCAYGNCTDLVNNYTCTCNAGYIGRNCSIDVNDCELNPCVNGNCTDLVNNYTCTCNAGYIGRNCRIECNQPLGMKNGSISDTMITASSIWGVKHEAYRARLNNQITNESIGAWVPKGMNGNLNFDSPGSFWIQVHLNPPKRVTGIITQGRPGNNNQYTTSFTISYSSDENDFTEIRKTFSGNEDMSTPVTNYFPTEILTSYIRLYPITWINAPALRMELLGC